MEKEAVETVRYEELGIIRIEMVVNRRGLCFILLCQICHMNMAPCRLFILCDVNQYFLSKENMCHVQ